MLISLHLPKTAGTSFLSSLEDYYGSKLLRDYADLPINTPVVNRNVHALKMCALNLLKSNHNIECVHGHFLPLKYLFCRNTTFVMWMRDPIERLASHYFYWQRKYDEEKAQPLHRRVIEENWSLEQFCLSPELRNIYSQFLWGIPIQRFDFIGIVEHYETEIKHFSRQFLEIEIEDAHVFEQNINPYKETKKYIEDKELLSKVANYHSKDITLYKRALKIRLEGRCNLNE